jgi:hypothetical protein
LRKRQRPNLAIVLVSDPRNETYGGTPVNVLSDLERIGIVVARTRLERMRDSNPLYSSLWRLTIGWWSNAYDEAPDGQTWTAALRRRNHKADRRQLLVADDGAGGWTSIVISGPAAADPAGSNAALELHGHLARDIASSELRIADWSTGDDRLPAAPPLESRGVGSIDARLLTEGAIHAALLDDIAAAGPGDSISLIGQRLGARGLIDAMRKAAARGAHLKLLLIPGSAETQAAAGELMQGGSGHIELRWQAAPHSEARYALIRHRNDVWLDLGSADFIRSSLDDLNLEADVELHMPDRAIQARAAADFFSSAWSRASPYTLHADESQRTYWTYRLAEATGLSMF